ncbi:hypothetical protein [Paraburkholderia hospita]|uniref:hypothetical protein n=1 Tax=Paraburkholderia hospita TaxID=169430 RepID=UPI003ED0551A
MLNLLNNLAAYADPLSKIGAGLAAIYGAWLWLAKLYEKQAAAMGGDWTNEGSFTGPPCSHSVSLQAKVTGSTVSGYVQALDADGQSPLASFTGWRFGPFMRVTVTHLRQGDLLNLGTITLRYRKGELLFTYAQPHTGLFPRRAALWRAAHHD